jgi:hypothetical protein
LQRFRKPYLRIIINWPGKESMDRARATPERLAAAAEIVLRLTRTCNTLLALSRRDVGSRLN